MASTEQLAGAYGACEHRLTGMSAAYRAAYYGVDPQSLVDVAEKSGVAAVDLVRAVEVFNALLDGVGSSAMAGAEGANAAVGKKKTGREMRAEAYGAACRAAVDVPGMCYLELVRQSKRVGVGQAIGAYPSTAVLVQLRAAEIDIEALSRCVFDEVAPGRFHVRLACVGDRGSVAADLRATLAVYTWLPSQLRRVVSEAPAGGRVLPYEAVFGAKTPAGAGVTGAAMQGFEALSQDRGWPNFAATQVASMCQTAVSDASNFDEVVVLAEGEKGGSRPTGSGVSTLFMEIAVTSGRRGDLPSMGADEAGPSVWIAPPGTQFVFAGREVFPTVPSDVRAVVATVPPGVRVEVITAAVMIGRPVTYLHASGLADMLGTRAVAPHFAWCDGASLCVRPRERVPADYDLHARVPLIQASVVEKGVCGEQMRVHLPDSVLDGAIADVVCRDLEFTPGSVWVLTRVKYVTNVQVGGVHVVPAGFEPAESGLAGGPTLGAVLWFGSGDRRLRVRFGRSTHPRFLPEFSLVCVSSDTLLHNYVLDEPAAAVWRSAQGTATPFVCGAASPRQFTGVFGSAAE